MANYAGEIAALAAAFSWTFASIFFAIASSRVGAVIVNSIRLVVAVALLLATHIALTGRWLPTDVGFYRWFWLGLSGVTSQVLGNTLLLQSLVWIGPRRTTLVLSLTPVISTFFAWIWLAENLNSTEILAVGLAVGGVAWTMWERENTGERRTGPKRYQLGILLALFGTVGEALSLVASKKGVVGDFDPLAANLIRMTVAAIAMWVITLLSGQLQRTYRALADRPASLAILGGAVAGPYLAVWLSFVAVKLTRVGIASALMSLQPVFLLLPSVWIFKERIGLRAVVGTMVVIAAVAMIFLA